MLRLKTTVQQVRTACANDVRKRDVQIQRLKSHLTAHQRGNRSGLVGASITITPGTTGSGATSVGRVADVPNVDDAEYSLKQETTEFLTQLSQSLSDENDNLIGLVRSTLATLRELQGLPEHGLAGPDPEAAHEDAEGAEAHIMHTPPPSYEALATDMDHVLENLRSLLTNPNFVSISEVESREEEIIKLREGWEKMEARWRDVVVMMQGWRQRMMDGGDTITLDELKMGLGPGEMLAPVEEEEEEDDDDDNYFDGEVDMEAGAMDDIHEESALPSPEKHDLFDIKLEPTPHQVLRESDGNTRSPRKVVFAPSNRSTPSLQFSPDENASNISLIKPDSRPNSKPTSRSGSRLPTSNKAPSSTRDQPQPSAENCSKITPRDSGIPRSTRKRRSSPLPHEDEPSPKLTVQEKLAIAAQEAEEAATAAAVAKGEEELKKQVEEISTIEENENINMRARRTPRRSNVKGRAKRRKSTLSPEELEALMGLAD
ncbi:Afadin/alpha-actinin-binding protein [Macrophomina phaseolina MS6]|uniref:Afadin/alpha-actinin-binding protein n=1 Tax=Macrophomina phaseolina (strain MS6) TaxID=1126212 RepID=K2R731_MACPH|nr:Afadin/alpha-actinin-binding protein [Macrophomina phaseolina MS6]